MAEVEIKGYSDKHTMRFVTFFLAVCPALLWGQELLVLKAARMYDGKSDKLVSPGVIVVNGGRIESIGGPAPAGLRTIDLGDATLLPGFLDAHTHLTMPFAFDFDRAELLKMRRSIPEQAIEDAQIAALTLRAGFTTVRDVGSSDFLDIGLRNAINRGVTPGPRYDRSSGCEPSDPHSVSLPTFSQGARWPTLIKTNATGNVTTMSPFRNYIWLF